MTSANGSALAEFLAETDEMLERIAGGLARVERQEHSRETLNSIYRDMHTIKGSAQLFGCEQMGQIAHAMETCLDPVRNGSVIMTAPLVDAIYHGIDLLKKLTDSLKETRREADFRADLQRLVLHLAAITSQLLGEGTPPPKDLPGIAEEISAVIPLKKDAPEASAQQVAKRPEAPKKPEKPATASAAGEPAEAQGQESIRVQVQVLDSLMNLVGELVLIRNQVIQYTNTAEEAEVVNLSQRLNIVTTELQNAVMKTRMQPIGNILSKFQRIVRDVARELGKEIELKLEGTETELDKTLIEAVKDPLTHIVRNSMDHGLEQPAERREAGKPSTGQILIRSFHEGGQVVVEVADDGRGLNRRKIGAKAVEKGLISAEVLDKMSDREVNNLIFLPGFSTADKVSNISGRGVGMDVVRTNIEKIGGVVDLSSTEGQGMAIRLKIPLTLAIVPALIVRSGNERFAIPQVKLVELVRVDGQDDGSASEIQMLQGQPFFRLRGNLLPLVSLNGVLKLEDLERRDGTNIAVLNADSRQFGLIVDSIEDSTDIVVKPLSTFLKNLGVYSGATVLGDGSVAIVLDVIGLAAEAHVFDEKLLENAQVAENREGELTAANDMTEYLVIDVGSPGRFAIPLCLVNRLEEFKRSQIERAGNQRVVRYRGSILPLVSVADHLALDGSAVRGSTGDNVSVVVVERDGRLHGLEVRAIIDVIAIEAPIDDKVKDRPSILGTCFHPDGVVVIVDAFRVIDEEAGKGSGKNKEPSGKSDRERSRFHVLLVEDNTFFRNHVLQILTSAGYRVTVDVNGEEALKRLQRAETGEFAVMVSDIEMPKMGGLELAERVRSQGRYSRMPLLALTTKSKEADRQKGLRSGFNKYLAKLDGDELIAELDASLGLALSAREAKHGT